MDFGKVMNRAWEILIKFKVLWIFGILASCAGPYAGGGVPPSFTPMSPGFFEDPESFTPSPEMERFFEQLSGLSEQDIEGFLIATLPFIGLIMVLGIVFQLFFFVLRSFGRVGIVQGVIGAENQSEAMRFGDLFNGTLPFMWRVLGLNFIFWLAYIVIFVGLFFGFVIGAGATGGLLALCILPLMCLFFIGFIAGYVILEYANNALVVEDLSITDAWRRGWSTFRGNLGNSIIMLLFVWVVTIVVGIMLMIPNGIIVSLAFSVIQTGDSGDFFQVIQDTWWVGLLTMPISLLGMGLLRTYRGSLWTLTYMELSQPKLLSSESEDEGVTKE